MPGSASTYGFVYLATRDSKRARDNVLFTDQGEPVLTDFGLSKIVGEERMYTSSHDEGGSMPWMAPECMMGVPKSCQSDIYSFGSLAFTVMTSELPYGKLPARRIPLKVWNSNNRNGPVEDWSKYPQLRGSIKELLTDCWSWEPSARPAMSAIIERLTALLESAELGDPAHPGQRTATRGFILVPTLALAIVFIGSKFRKWAFGDDHKV
ncbi:hypothetical protein FRC01_006236 [Tulasnella sp. 417]|nr:hypothetical protein FRC01_006236 [Tulasnella sp. 417]